MRFSARVRISGGYIYIYTYIIKPTYLGMIGILISNSIIGIARNLNQLGLMDVPTSLAKQPRLKIGGYQAKLYGNCMEFLDV